MPKYGAACDNLILAQPLTVDGRQVEASQSSHPDLFWSIRAGGGNFGMAAPPCTTNSPQAKALRAAVLLRLGRRGR